MAQIVSFIGLGVMGRPMARNLMAAGFDVVAFTRSSGSRENARADGISVVDEISSLPLGADFVVTMLPDAGDVEDVLFAPDGPATQAGPDTLFVDMSTIAPDAARAIGERLAQSGHGFLDAPVSGGEVGAVNGELSIMVGGGQADMTRAAPLFDAMGSTVVHVGPTGAGQITKAANQMIVATNLAILGEALVFLEANGLNVEGALAVIGGGLAGSAVLARKAPAMQARSFEPGFRLALHAKDLRIAADAANATQLPLPVNALVTQIVRSLVATGRGDLDHSALFLAAAEFAGRAPGESHTR